jgi:hypothetical protein
MSYFYHVGNCGIFGLPYRIYGTQRQSPLIPIKPAYFRENWDEYITKSVLLIVKINKICGPLHKEEGKCENVSIFRGLRLDTV